jgi:hypothetical protein
VADLAVGDLDAFRVRLAPAVGVRDDQHGPGELLLGAPLLGDLEDGLVAAARALVDHVGDLAQRDQEQEHEEAQEDQAEELRGAEPREDRVHHREFRLGTAR